MKPPLQITTSEKPQPTTRSPSRPTYKIIIWWPFTKHTSKPSVINKLSAATKTLMTTKKFITEKLITTPATTKKPTPKTSEKPTSSSEWCTETIIVSDTPKRLVYYATEERIKAAGGAVKCGIKFKVSCNKVWRSKVLALCGRQHKYEH